MILTLEKLQFVYGEVHVIKGISLGLSSGEFLVVLGPNGSGKSTLIKLAAGLLEPRDGTITLNGLNLSTLSPRNRARHIAYVPQSTYLAFSDTVFETVLLGRSPHFGWSPSALDLEKTDRVLSELDIAELASYPYASLSGGQQQRVLIARALVQDTNLVLLDEPTSALDISHQLGTLALLRSLVERQGKTVIVVLHDLNLAARFATRIVLMNRGEIAADGIPGDVLRPDLVASVFNVDADIFLHQEQLVVVPQKANDLVMSQKK